MKIKTTYLYLALALLLALFLAYQTSVSSNSLSPAAKEPSDAKTVEPADKITEIEITDNDTYGNLMKEAGVPVTAASDIFQASQEVYDLSKIRAGHSLFLYYDGLTNELKQLVYQIDSEEELYVIWNHESGIKNQAEVVASSSEAVKKNDWTARRQPIDYEIKVKTVAGTLETSLYQFALDNNVDIRAIIDLADAFQWTIDFAMDPKVGDTFEFIYEERYRDGEYKMPGRILAGQYVNEGTEYKLFYFAEDADNSGYFDEQGNSVQKIFLKAPIQYKYITSGFTTGLRCLETFNLCTNHRAIDYAAAAGTPIRAVGDGTVVSAGWNSGGYGNLTSIRHNETYTTNYAHQSKILVKYGQKVKQGDIIGKVGSTGLSTGPHLHYEMVKHGVKINPLKEILPVGKPIKEENRERFFQSIEQYNAQFQIN